MGLSNSKEEAIGTECLPEDLDSMTQEAECQQSQEAMVSQRRLMSLLESLEERLTRMEATPSASAGRCGEQEDDVGGLEGRVRELEATVKRALEGRFPPVDAPPLKDSPIPKPSSDSSTSSVRSCPSNPMEKLSLETSVKPIPQPRTRLPVVSGSSATSNAPIPSASPPCPQPRSPPSIVLPTDAVSSTPSQPSLPSSVASPSHNTSTFTPHPSASVLSTPALFSPRSSRRALFLEISSSTTSMAGNLSACTSSPSPLSEQRIALGNELHKAVEEGRVEDVQRLLEEGANVNHRDEHAQTPLHWAAFLVHANVVSLLLEKGANVNARSNVGSTALHHATVNDRSGRCVELLIDKGADVKCVDYSGRSPLHWAAIYGNKAAMRALIAAAAEVDLRDNFGQTALHCASMWDKNSEVRVLIGAGAGVNILDNRERTPLHWAALEGHKITVNALIQAEAEVNCQDSFGQTPLHCASMYGKIAIVRALIEARSDINIEDKTQKTALHWASLYGHKGVARELFEAGTRNLT